MKLRIFRRSLRYRLSESEFEDLLQSGEVLEELPSSLSEPFYYGLRLNEADAAELMPVSGLVLAVPAETLQARRDRAPGDRVLLKTVLPPTAGAGNESLAVLVEIEAPRRHSAP